MLLILLLRQSSLSLRVNRRPIKICWTISIKEEPRLKNRSTTWFRHRVSHLSTKEQTHTTISWSLTIASSFWSSKHLITRSKSSAKSLVMQKASQVNSSKARRKLTSRITATLFKRRLESVIQAKYRWLSLNQDLPKAFARADKTFKTKIRVACKAFIRARRFCPRNRLHKLNSWTRLILKLLLRSVKHLQSSQAWERNLSRMLRFYTINLFRWIRLSTLVALKSRIKAM